MKTSRFASILLLSGFTAFANVTSASDELAGALIGAGTGAVIGNAIDRHDGAIVGGILGAVIGVAIADDNDDRRPVHVQHGYSQSHYRPAPVVIHQPPRVRYVTQPVYVKQPVFVTQHHYVKTYPAPYYWKHDRFDRRDHRWDRDHDRRHDGRHGRDGRDGRD